MEGKKGEKFQRRGRDGEKEDRKMRRQERGEAKRRMIGERKEGERRVERKGRKISIDDSIKEIPY